MRGVRFVVSALASIGLSVAANAAVVPTFSATPDAVSAGERSTLSLILNLFPDAGYFNATFTGGSVTLNSGIGSSQTFNILPGGTSQTFSWSFTYPVAGNYAPSFSFFANYSEQYSTFQQTGGYWVNRGYPILYPCGLLTLCWRWIDLSYFQPTYGYVNHTIFTGQSDSDFGFLAVRALANEPPVAQTPLPAAFPLFATILAGAGLIAWGRKRRTRRLV